MLDGTSIEGAFLALIYIVPVLTAWGLLTFIAERLEAKWPL